MKVLVVDDTASSRKLLRATLEMEGVTVGEASDGVDALAVLEHDKFDAVVSDILMPRMDGYSLCREIRRDPRLRNLPVIAYTSTYLSKGDEQLAMRSGADCYLRKPTSVKVLLAILTELLQTGATARPVSSTPEDPLIMYEYNSLLVRKLEEKSREIEQRNEELRRANGDLDESRARFEGIIASAMDAMITIDEADKIVLFNAAAEAMFGSTAAAMLGQLLSERIRLDRDGSFGPFESTGMNIRQMGSLGAISGRRVNGEEFPIEASFSRAEVAGRQFFTVILRDISGRKLREEQLRLANEQLRALTARNETIRENERMNIAREIHDVLAQELTRLKIDLKWLAKRAAQPIDEQTRDAMATQIGDAIARTDVAITTVQRIATELRPVILDSLGLPAAVEWQVEDFARRTGLSCRTRAPRGDSTLSRECATAIFRILQESLTNIARHARATKIEVQFFEDPDVAVLIVEDNGLGITAAQMADAHSIGLVGMRERAQAFGGSVEITGAPGVGTTVSVRIPLDRENATNPS